MITTRLNDRPDGLGRGRRRFETVAAAAAGLGGVLGLVALFGRLVGNRELTGGVAGLPTMKVNTALAFIVAGFSVWLLRAPTSADGAARRSRQVC